MENIVDRIIRIAAALIDDEMGRLLLVRKTGTSWFMQAGGKIENDESPLCALRRELDEEIGLSLGNESPPHLGRFLAAAANEPGHVVEAEIFHVRSRHVPAIQSEIEEALWVDPDRAVTLPLAPLTRDCILPLFRRLSAIDL